MWVGYAFLKDFLRLSAPEPAVRAQVMGVTRVQRTDRILAVPAHVAPVTKDPLEHLLFALKHEGTNMAVLMEALPKIDTSVLARTLRATPNGRYVRVAAYLWEHATGQVMEGISAGGPVVDVFASERYVTGPQQRSAKWRVNFNGLGTTAYSATVERTPEVNRALQDDVLKAVARFAEAIDKPLLDRALGWAYLSETRDSFAIEREAPGEARQAAFVRLLHAAQDHNALTEDYLCDLQAATVSNPYSRAVKFRHTQNYLVDGARGAVGVTYIPPPPALCFELMTALMAFANGPARLIEPLVAASVVSFGFVYLHPFVDGNGRLSRFLFHHALAQSGKLPHGLLLPVSMAMKRNEAAYLATLQTVSKPIRSLWHVNWAGDDRVDCTFVGSDVVYRHWEASACVAFGLRMAKEALSHDLMHETEYLGRYDAVSRQINQQTDLPGPVLAMLIRAALENGGEISKNKRKKAVGKATEDDILRIEELAREALGKDNEAGSGNV